MKAELVQYVGSDLTFVNAARVSMGKHSEKLTDKDKKLIKYLIKNKHWSPFEHAYLTFRIHCPIYVARQVMRHRSHSFNEISGRYVEFEPSFYIPDEFREQDPDVKQGSSDRIIEDYFIDMQYKIAMENAYNTYQRLLDHGVCKEQARGVLPLSLYTEFYQSMNFRSFIHYLDLRLEEHAQKETRDLTEMMLMAVVKTGAFNETLKVAGY